jgi:aminocarboxymuconate-semialdehyde decarboxylase
MRIIDCDSHFLTCDIYKNIEEQYQNLLPKYKFDSHNRVIDIQFDQDPCTFKDPGIRFTRHCEDPGINNIDIRLNDFKKLKIDMQLLGPQERAMRFNYSVEKNLAAAMAHSYNIEIKKIVDQYPDKFFAVALVPLQDIDLSLRELDWIISNNFKSIYIDCLYYDLSDNAHKPLSTYPRINEIFAVCEKNNIIIFQHHYMHKVPSQSTDIINIIDKSPIPNRVAISIYDWLVSGIFEQFPNLQVVLTETTENLIKNIFKNMQAFYDTNSQSNKLVHYLKYFKKNLFITIEVENKDNVYYLIDKIGSDRLLFNNDYPHIDPAGVNKWNDVYYLYKLELSQVDLENIAFRNAEKLFKLI